MKYRYRAVDGRGRRVRGHLEAANRRDAVRRLHERGLYPLELAATGEPPDDVSHRVNPAAHATRWTPGRSIWPRRGTPAAADTTRGRPAERRTPGSLLRAMRMPALSARRGAPVKGIAVFTRQLATLIRAGVGVAPAIEVLAAEAEDRALARALAAVAAEIQGGRSLSAALADHPRVFPPLLVNLARAGEASGALDEVMERAANHFEKQFATREKVKSALAYPLFVGIAAVLVTAVLLVKVVPTFAALFASYNAALPWPTRIVLGASHLLGRFAWLVLAVLAVIWAGYRVSLRAVRVRLWRDAMRLRTPVFGVLALRTALATMARTMATLFASGVPVLECMDLTAAALDNAVLARALARAREGVASGERLSDRLRGESAIPALVTHMIRVGEETGNLDVMLAKAADFYEAEADALADRLKALLEPMLVLVLAVIVGIIVLSVIAPMFTLYQQMENFS
ncbi:type II secretion system F family protein [Alicyclobacillus sp.]|uniref:type II secretion system F family protein n=1 Tax=Alicyclobacillus sp. TaxID=61169 RepID=UPI0025BDCE4E|nr:type II secretion system F family protein [Alicyclobacillus sp.]MCL6518183.1 type II secretion system F family protein [Alicyclobacillus sp.]